MEHFRTQCCILTFWENSFTLSCFFVEEGPNLYHCGSTELIWSVNGCKLFFESRNSHVFHVLITLSKSTFWTSYCRSNLLPAHFTKGCDWSGGDNMSIRLYIIRATLCSQMSRNLSCNHVRVWKEHGIRNRAENTPSSEVEPSWCGRDTFWISTCTSV